jgi:DNA-binding Lrp family transcriptional regulator
MTLDSIDKKLLSLLQTDSKRQRKIVFEICPLPQCMNALRN